MLTSAGLSRSDCRLDYICRHNPAGNNSNYLHQSEELKDGLKQIREFIKEHKGTLKSILFLGELCLSYIHGEHGIDDWRGSVILFEDIPTVQTYSLRALTKSPGNYPFVSFDVAKAVTLLDKPYAPIKYEFIKNPTGYQLIELANEYSQAEFLANDLETSMGADRIYCNGYAKSATEAIILVNDSGDTSLDSQFDAASRILNLSPAKKIYQNCLFDLAVWERNGHEVENLYWDTMIGMHVLQPEFPRGLDFMCSIYTMQPYYKNMTAGGDGKKWSGKVNRNVLWEYNGIDCCCTYDIAMQQMVELQDAPRLRSVFDYEMDMVPVSLHLSRTGMLYDLETRAKLIEIVVKKYDYAQETLNNIFKQVVNVNSPKLKDRLYGEWKLPLKKDPKTNAVTTGEDAIVSLITFCEGKIHEYKTEDKKNEWRLKQFGLRLILLIRGYQQIKSNYLDADLHEDNRCRSSWKIAATKTGRWAATKFIDDTGLNATTFPREVIEYE